METVIFFLIEHFWLIIDSMLCLMALAVSLTITEKVNAFINKHKKKHE